MLKLTTYVMSVVRSSSSSSSSQQPLTDTKQRGSMCRQPVLGKYTIERNIITKDFTRTHGVAKTTPVVPVNLNVVFFEGNVYCLDDFFLNLLM